MAKIPVWAIPGGGGEVGVYGQLSKNGAQLKISFLLADLPEIPGYYAVQAYYLGAAGGYMTVHFCVSVRSESNAYVMPDNTIARGSGPDYVPSNGAYGSTQTFFNVSVSNGTVNIIINSAALTANWAVSAVDENSYVRAIPIGLPE